jgi:hypothetical protein
MGATPEQIQRRYNDRKISHRAQIVEKENPDLSNQETWKKSLGVMKHYRAFLLFFQKELEIKGIDTVINEYLFAGDEKAEDMLVRLHEAFLHPLIHFGFGIEFQQPAILAEGLAQAAVHATTIGNLLLPAEILAKKTGATRMKKTIVQLLDECQADDKLKNAPHWSDDNKVYDGILERAPDKMMRIASQVVVGEDEIEEKTAEMINAASMYILFSFLYRMPSSTNPAIVYFTAAA